MDSSSESVIVFTGGDPVAPGALADLPRDAYVVAADSGLDHVRRLGWRADLAVGDFDSVSSAALEAAERQGTIVERHPVAKDATDLELALDRARSLAPRHIVVVGGHGGRVDHLLGNALALTGPARDGIEVEAYTGAGHLVVVTSRRMLTGRPAEIVTLLPVHGPAHGVTTAGLRYPLRGETLHAGSTRGISNQFLDAEAEVSVADGLLLVVAPGALGPPLPDQQETHQQEDQP